MAEVDFLQQELEDNPFEEDVFPEEPPEEPPPEQPSAELQTLRDQAALVQRFNTDPEYARQVVLERARQLGLQLQAPERPAARPQGPPAELVTAIQQQLAPEMQFIAPHLVQATWAAVQEQLQQQLQEQLGPLKQQQANQLAQQRDTAFTSMARDLTQESPGWERYEDDMMELLTFLRGALDGSASQTHPKYGSTLKLLYRLASGDAQATAQAGRRMQQAARSVTRTSSGGATRQNGPDLQTLIDRAPNNTSKWGLAYRHALREHGVAS